MVNLKFTYNKSDYMKAMRFHVSTKLNLKLDIIALLVICSLGVYFIVSEGFNGMAVLLFSISGIFLSLLIYGFYVMPFLAYNTSSKLKDEYDLTFSENGIDFKTKNVSSKLEWSLYTKVLENSSVFLLYHGINELTVIPKSVFQNDDDIRLFSELIHKHIKIIKLIA